MALAPRLDLRQAQTLVMTPQLQQAIKLLQLSNLELAAYVERELEQNPLLEREDAEDAEGGGAIEAPGAGEAVPGEEAAERAALGDDGFDQPDSLDLVGPGNPDAKADAALDTDFNNLWSSDSAADSPAPAEAETLYWQVSGGVGANADGGEMDGAPADQPSLRDHLIGQINMDLDDAIDRIIAVHLVDLLDEAGYLPADLGEVAETLGCAPARVAATLDRIQRFDPPGIFARDLAECLALQLRDRDRFDPAMQALLDNLDLLAKRRFEALRKRCGVGAEDLAEMVNEIKALNPKPALAFDPAVAQPITPDVLVRPRAAGGWAVELNNDTLPRVLVNNRYYAEISRQSLNKTEKEYITECYQAANWLVKALHQRAQTILKVATELVRQQDAFLSRGVQYLKPLVLRDIAGAVEVHESTVSRVTNNKYIATPRGIFEMKYFFTFAVADSQGGAAHSAEAVRFRIRTLIERESVDDVLSDDRIVAILRREGIEIARRTVAKYRESMRIPSSVRRRREKALQA